VLLWDAATGKELARLRHGRHISAVALSADGRRALTGAWDNTARLWDIETGKELARLRHDVFVNAVALSPDGRRVLTTSNDKTARVWEVAPEAPDQPERLEALVHLLTGKTFDARGALRWATPEELSQARKTLDALGGDWRPRPSARAWHLLQADNAEQQNNAFAVLFHLDRLEKLGGLTPELQRRRDRARQMLKAKQP
jgi:WD40 repeat protein